MITDDITLNTTWYVDVEGAKVPKSYTTSTGTSTSGCVTSTGPNKYYTTYTPTPDYGQSTTPLPGTPFPGKEYKLIISPNVSKTLEIDLEKLVDELEEKGIGEVKYKEKPKPKDLIKNVQFNTKKRTVTVLWKDGTVTVVKCHKDDVYDKEKGLAMCFIKKAYDNRGCFNDFMKKWLEEGEEI